MKVTYGPKIDYRWCNGCKKCYDACPQDIYDWDDEKGLPIVAYPEECYICGFCELNCPQLAINVELPLAVRYFFSIYPKG